jgi:hypothetical protein
MRTIFPSRMPTFAHGIHAGFGIHDASAFQHEIELLC